MGEAADFGGCSVYPLGSIGAAQELRVLEGGAGGWVDHGVSVVDYPLEVGDGGARRWDRWERNNQRCGGIEEGAGDDTVGAWFAGG